MWQVKYINKPPAEHQNRYCADLLRETPIYKATKTFDSVTRIKLGDNLRNFYFHCDKTYGH